MNIESELNKRLTKTGIYSNHYSLKESINHLTGYIFLSKKWIYSYIIDKIAYQKNDNVYTEDGYTEYYRLFLDKSQEFYKRKIDRFSRLPRRLYVYSFLLILISLFLYVISFKIFHKWIWLEQIGVSVNLFLLIAVISVLFMSLSFFLLPIRGILIKKYHNIILIINDMLNKKPSFPKAEEKVNTTYNSVLNLINHLYILKKIDVADTLLLLIQQTQILGCYDFPISQKNVTRLIALMIHDKYVIKSDAVELQDLSNIITAHFTWKGKQFNEKSFGNALSDTLVTSKIDLKDSLKRNSELSQLLRTDKFSFINQYWLEIG